VSREVVQHDVDCELRLNAFIDLAKERDEVGAAVLVTVQAA
jgi:hypothetical protein